MICPQCHARDLLKCVRCKQRFCYFCDGNKVMRVAAQLGHADPATVQCIDNRGHQAY